MAEITYLLGAGASCNALPIVTDMAVKVEEATKWVETIYRDYSIISRFSSQDAAKFKNVISDLKYLTKICEISRNFSVDTYARKLSLAGKNEEYYRLKNILSFYFTIEQKHKQPDVRYDNFWASILAHRSHFPDNIKIISWNYDFQLELTYKDFLNVDSLKESRENLNVTSLETNPHNFNNPKSFGIFKLNGSATYDSSLERGVNYLVDQFSGTTLDDFIIKSVQAYDNLTSKNLLYKNHLSFAWEHQIKNPFYSYLKMAIENTEILVVIGYSFPFFNRNTDKLILNEFMGEKLRKVYFQAPEKEVEDIRERFLAINDTIDLPNLVLRKDIRQFTLPNEL